MSATSPFTRAELARAARGDIEAALDRGVPSGVAVLASGVSVGWRWSRALSLWLDALIVLEESGDVL